MTFFRRRAFHFRPGIHDAQERDGDSGAKAQAFAKRLTNECGVLRIWPAVAELPAWSRSARCCARAGVELRRGRAASAPCLSPRGAWRQVRSESPLPAPSAGGQKGSGATAFGEGPKASFFRSEPVEKRRPERGWGAPPDETGGGDGGLLPSGRSSGGATSDRRLAPDMRRGGAGRLLLRARGAHAEAGAASASPAAGASGCGGWPRFSAHFCQIVWLTRAESHMLRRRAASDGDLPSPSESLPAALRQLPKPPKTLAAAAPRRLRNSELLRRRLPSRPQPPSPLPRDPTLSVGGQSVDVGDDGGSTGAWLSAQAAPPWGPQALLPDRPPFLLTPLPCAACASSSSLSSRRPRPPPTTLTHSMRRRSSASGRSTSSWISAACGWVESRAEGWSVRTRTLKAGCRGEEPPHAAQQARGARRAAPARTDRNALAERGTGRPEAVSGNWMGSSERIASSISAGALPWPPKRVAP